MTTKHFYLPRKESECKEDYGDVDRPTANEYLFYRHVNNTYMHEWTDHNTGVKVNFGRTLSGGDNKMKNLHDIWLHDTGYGQTWGYCHKTNYISWHVGAIPNLHSLGEIKNFSQCLLPGYVGIRFQYRWPDDNSRNYWKNSPVHINDMMLHYYNAFTNECWSYEATLMVASPSNSDFWPDRYEKNDSRRSNDWKGCYWKPPGGPARNEIRNNQLFLIGASFEMKYTDRGGASHSRCMDIRNFTPVWSKADEASYVPLMTKKQSDPWTARSASIQVFTN